MEYIWNELKTKLKNFCDENGFDKVILGLSGGIDSALVAVLAADALGGENVTAIMMHTKYTSDLSLNIARQIAKLNKLDYHELDIQPLFVEEVKFLSTAFGETPKDIVLENLQARARGKILMAWSNQNGGVVLACGNKSEALTGYCTLYGDICGGVMPIGGLYKTTVFALAKWRNELNTVLPEAVISRAPSAELKANQKDENTLPPYKILDSILRLYVDENKSKDEIVKYGFDNEVVEWVINRYQTSAFKRLQMPPALLINQHIEH